MGTLTSNSASQTAAARGLKEAEEEEHANSEDSAPAAQDVPKVTSQVAPRLAKSALTRTSNLLSVAHRCPNALRAVHSSASRQTDIHGRAQNKSSFASMPMHVCIYICVCDVTHTHTRICMQMIVSE